jgi:hypothetical protein
MYKFRGVVLIYHFHHPAKLNTNQNYTTRSEAPDLLTAPLLGRCPSFRHFRLLGLFSWRYQHTIISNLEYRAPEAVGFTFRLAESRQNTRNEKKQITVSSAVLPDGTQSRILCCFKLPSVASDHDEQLDTFPDAAHHELPSFSVCVVLL